MGTPPADRPTAVEEGIVLRMVTWRRVVIGLVAASVLGIMAGAGPLSAQAESLTPERALERLFVERPVQPDWFAPAFLAHVSAPQVQAIVDQLMGTLGRFERVEREGASHVVVLERGLVPAQVTLDDQGRFMGLFFQAPRARAAGDSSRSAVREAVAAFEELPGRVSVVVVEDGQIREALAADQPMAVGSAFKLAILAALADQIRSGHRHWDDVVHLEPQWKSLPSGILQSWPDGAPLTLYSLAALMISVSDNTAADTLLHLVGRETVEALAPRNRPFLSTREAFVLKAPQNEALLARYRAGDEAERRALLPEIGKQPLPGVETFMGEPRALDVEWFFTGTELCALMERVRDLPLMGINPGVARPEDWTSVAFKGGSEPGVLNLTTALTARDGRRLCVAATWNDDKALDEMRFISLYSLLLDALK